MKKLLDILKEIRVTPNFRIPDGWSEIDPKDIYQDEELFDGGRCVEEFIAPMEGWEEDNYDVIRIILLPNGKYALYVSYAFGEGGIEEEEFSSQYDAKKAAIELMKEIKRSEGLRDN